MSISPHSGIIDFGTFTPPSAPLNGIQGEVPAPLLVESGYLLSTSGWVPAASGSGTVTSVAATVPSFLSITGSPITTSGTLAIAYSGTALPIANGGTGATTAAEAFSDLTPLTLTTASATTLVLTNTSGYQQQIIGSANQTITLPSTATLAVGWSFLITNATSVTATGYTVTVQTSTGATVYTNSNIGSYRVWCISTANNNAASWSVGAETFSFETGTGSVVRATSPTFSSIAATGNLNLSGSTFQSALFASAQTTGNTVICSVQTSGTLTIGGASGTGTQTIGRSTVSQQTDIQAGATASGSTKAINIGTAGLSGSTTAINIGSAVSGSLGTTTIQAPTVNIGQTATQFQVTNTASAVNYVQTTGSLTGFGAKLLSAGTDTNIPLVLQPKGTGALQAQQTDSTTAGGNARGANAVDWQTSRGAASQVASGQNTFIGGGTNNTVTGAIAGVLSGGFSSASAQYAVVAGGAANTAGQYAAGIVAGQSNGALGYFNLIGGGVSNSGTSGTAVTTQATTTVTNGSTAVTLSGSNANIKVGQLIAGTGLPFPTTYVAAISGTSLTLSVAATATGTPTLSFFTPHGVVVGGGNNQATGSYSFIGGGGDAGTAANRNVASGDWSFVGGGQKNTASGSQSFVGGGGTNLATSTGTVVAGGLGNFALGFGSSTVGGNGNQSNGTYSFVGGGQSGTNRSIGGLHTFPACISPVASGLGISQSSLLVLGVQTTDATATALRSDTSAAGTTNQVILPNNSAYFFTGEVISGVTGGGDTKGFTIEGVIKRGANAASTALVGTPTVTSSFADAGAATWTIAVTADTTNGGLRVTFTGQASTTIRTVCQIRTTEMTY